MQRKRLSSSGAAAAAIIGGNDDILTETLVLLPVKSLVRFTGVSKHLRSLINDETFHHRHLNSHRRRPQHQFILRTTEKPHKTFICDLTSKTLRPLRLRSEVESGRGLGSYGHVRVLQSSHGLLLLECRRSPRAEIYIYVYNPITATGTAVLRRLPRDDYSRFCLIYDPSKSNDYTVFRFIARTRTFGVVDVYDSRTRKWEMSTGKYGQTLKGFPQGVLCNGRLYFIRSHSPSMCFSLENLQFSAVPNPPICPSGKKKYVVESNGHLHYLVPNLSHLDVYELIDDQRWVASRRVDSGGQLRARLGVEWIEVLGFVRGERVEDSILVYQVFGKIMVYRFRVGFGEEIVSLASYGYCQDQVRLLLNFEFKNSHQFTESFAYV